jgi:hypothetical protein
VSGILLPVDGRRAICSLSLVLALAGLTHAAEVEISPDRPDVTNSTKTVPEGFWQLESGLAYTGARQAGGPLQQRLAVEESLRIGLTDRLEVRVDGGPVIVLRGGGDPDHGGLAFGFKYRFFDAVSGWPSLGVQPFVRVPFAPAGSGRPDLGAVALASWELPSAFTLDVNAGMAAVAQAHPDGYLLQALVSASFGKQVTERLSGFVELFFASRGERGGRDSLGFDTGFIFLLTPRLAVDAAITTSLTGRGPDYALRAGISVMVGR